MDDRRREPRARPGAFPSRHAPPKILRTGTYLQTHCPLCGAEIVEGDWIRFSVLASDGREGELLLSARFNVFDRTSSLGLSPGDLVADMRCPRCHGSLLLPDRRCDYCHAPAVAIRVTAVRTELTLLLCSRFSCHWHGIGDADGRQLVLEEEP